MRIEICETGEGFDTQYAPLAAILAKYQAEKGFEPLEKIPISMKSRDFTATDKLIQVLVSILAGCETLSEVNIRLKAEQPLARAGGWPRFADQSTLSRMLDALSQKQIEQMQEANREIWWSRSQIRERDWRKYLWLDFDLSGLPCSAQAEKSTKGYFSGKKTQRVANWPGSVPLGSEKPSGQTSFLAIDIRPTVCKRRCWAQKVL